MAAAAKADSGSLSQLIRSSVSLPCRGAQRCARFSLSRQAEVCFSSPGQSRPKKRRNYETEGGPPEGAARGPAARRPPLGARVSRRRWCLAARRGFHDTTSRGCSARSCATPTGAPAPTPPICSARAASAPRSAGGQPPRGAPRKPPCEAGGHASGAASIAVTTTPRRAHKPQASASSSACTACCESRDTARGSAVSAPIRYRKKHYERHHCPTGRSLP